MYLDQYMFDQPFLFYSGGLSARGLASLKTSDVRRGTEELNNLMAETNELKQRSRLVVITVTCWHTDL